MEPHPKIQQPLMTDQTKTTYLLFARKVLTDKKLPHFFRSIFFPTHHLICFCLFFLSVGMDLIGKRRGGKFGLSVLFIPHQKLYYYNTVTNNLLCA
jgi:hypothetical protein